MTTFEVKKFDLKTMKPSRCSLAIGLKGRGKSKLIENIMYNNKDDVDLALAIASTEDSQQMFAEHLGYAMVWTDFDVDRIQNIIDEQRHNKGAMDRPFKLIIFMDDMGFDERLWKNKTMLYLLFNQRHVDIQVVFTVQYVLSIKPDIRSNIDYVFAFNEKITKNRQKLYENFFGVFTNYASFEKTFRACTQNFECLVLDNTQQSNNLNDTVFYFKADINLPPFKVGRPKFHELDKYLRVKGGKKRPVVPMMVSQSSKHSRGDEPEDTGPEKITHVVKAKPKKSSTRKTRGPPINPIVLSSF